MRVLGRGSLVEEEVVVVECLGWGCGVYRCTVEVVSWMWRRGCRWPWAGVGGLEVAAAAVVALGR